ncbi:MAG: universal stress protein [Cytophagaceae bacterium]|nr:universal stress protein [Cytophagaceae bacterium]
MKTIIVPTDLSPGTDAALSVAVDLARTSGATILLLHVVVYPLPMPDYAYTISMAVSTDRTVAEYREIEQEAEASLKRFADHAAYNGVTIIPTLITNGDGLVHNVTERPADLIVMASKGASGLNEFLFGSNAEEIVRYAHCPVLIVKQPIARFKPENIVCAVDVDDRLKATWHYPFPMGEKGLHQFLYILTSSDDRDPEGVRDWVNDFARVKGITEFEFIVRPAPTVPEGITRYADEVNADLVVLFTQGHKGLQHLLFGSVAEDVLNHATMPVLIMRV